MKEKYYKFALYIYNDDNNTVYLSNVKVSPVMRNRGLGNELLSVAEMWAKKFVSTAHTIMLKCLKESWVIDWYKRHGYTFHSNDEEDNRYAWLMKDLKG